MTVKKTIVEKIENDLKVSYVFCDGENERSFWFSVHSEYEKYLTIDRADGVLLMLMDYALHNGHDIKLEQPVSDRLLYQINSHWLPAVTRSLDIPGCPVSLSKYEAIRVICPAAQSPSKTDSDKTNEYWGGSYWCSDSYRNVLWH